MHHKIGFTNKTLSTLCAHVLLRFRVSLLVSKEVRTGDEASTTIRTRERLLPRVGSLMVDQVRPRGKTSPTLLTRKRLLSRMDPLVFDEV